MRLIKRLLNDILLLRVKLKKDQLGDSSEYSHLDLQALGIDACFVQDNQSASAEHVLRGLHYQIQHPQGKLIRLLSGKIYDVAVDLRSSSSTFGQHAALEINVDDEGLMLWIPPGFAHGFFVMEGVAEVMYSVTNYYNPLFERTLLWSDPVLAIDWPFGEREPLMSEKDMQGTLFRNSDYFS